MDMLTKQEKDQEIDWYFNLKKTFEADDNLSGKIMSGIRDRENNHVLFEENYLVRSRTFWSAVAASAVIIVLAGFLIAGTVGRPAIEDYLGNRNPYVGLEVEDYFISPVTASEWSLLDMLRRTN